MTKQQIWPRHASFSKRKSIGLANLVDAAPLSSPYRVIQKERLHKRRSKVAAVKDDDVSTASMTENGLPVEAQDDPEKDTKDIAAAVASDPGDAVVTRDPEPTTPRGATVAGVALYDAIANDTFFDVMTRLGIELCGNDDDAARLRTTAAAVVNVNNFKDSAHGKTLLHQACKMANLQVLKCLLYHGASTAQQCVMGRSPFHDVISSGKRDRALVVLQTLYEYEPRGISLVDINGTHVVHLAAIHGCLDVLQWCATLALQPDAPLSMAITSFSGRNVLHYAAYNGRLAVLEWLLQDHAAHAPSIASLDVNGYSVLHYAAMGGHLDISQWLVYCAPSRRDLNIVGTNSDGNTALDLAKQPEVQAFFEEVSQVPDAPSQVECIGVDNSSMGITWKFEPTIQDRHLREELAPKWFEIEFCRKPTGLRRASAMLSMLMIMPSETASAAALSASSYLLDWDQLDVYIQPDSTEHWLTGLESDTEYLVRMRTFNRNGYSEYSIPSLSGEFKTTPITPPLPKKSSFFELLLAPAPPKRTLEMPFIGTLDMELLEARRLLHCASQQIHTRQVVADQGRFFGVITLELPPQAHDAPAQRRRSSLSIFNRDTGDHVTTASAEMPRSRCLYRMRTDFASVQQDLLLAGSTHAFRHPQFDLHTKLRIPEVLDAELIIEIHHETPSTLASVVGVVRIPVVDVIRGFPAKMQWHSLAHGGESLVIDGCDETHGEVLIRSLFLADGVTGCPHPKNPDVLCSTAKELLDDSDGTIVTASSTPNMSIAWSSLSDSPSSASSDNSELSPRGPSAVVAEPVTYDALGFRIWATQDSSSLRSYEYYRLHQQAVAQQQECLWMRFHRDMSVNEVKANASTLVELLAQDDNNLATYEPSHARHSTPLRRLVWGGLPPTSRRVLFMRMSGADGKRRRAGEGYYQQQLSRAMALKAAQVDVDHPPLDRASEEGKFDKARKQIDVDLKRTFGGNQSWINSSDGQAALERVLLAYAIHNGQIGYCQSMSFIAGRLLCLFHDIEIRSNQVIRTTKGIEESVFWLLAALCEDYFPTNYTKGMEGLHVDGLVLEKLLKKRLPKVTRHIQVVLHNPPQMGLLLVTGWLLPVFCAVFPSETSARLLDVLFYEGSSVVFALILTFLRMAQPQMILETKDYMQLFRLLKERDQRLHDTGLLMEIALDEHVLIEKDIPTLRQQCQEEYEKSRRFQELAQLKEQHERQRQRSKTPSTTTYF